MEEEGKEEKKDDSDHEYLACSSPSSPLDLDDKRPPESEDKPAQDADDKPKASWTDKDCELFIKLYKEETLKLGLKGLVTNRIVCEHLSERMKEHNLYFTPHQIEGKIKSFKRSIKKQMIQKTKVRKRKQVPAYEKELETLFIEKNTTTNPPSVETVEMKPMEDTPMCTTEPAIDPVVSVVPAVPVSPVVPVAPVVAVVPASEETPCESIDVDPEPAVSTNPVANEIKLWREQLEQENQLKREYRNAKLEAYKERTKELKQIREQKNKLLALFITIQNRKRELQ